MRFLHQPAGGTRAATQLWLMLPGAYMKPGDFIEAGFVRAVRQRGLPHDISLLEATIAEIADGSALAYLQDFLRAQAAFGGSVRLLGISLGAHLAMACLARAGRGEPEQAAARRVDGAVLLAPYLGPRDIVAQVAAGAPLAPGDIDREIWHWLRHRAAGCELTLGYGADDRFAAAHALMAALLPPERVDVQPGGHAWPVWSALWERHLENNYVQ